MSTPIDLSEYWNAPCGVDVYTADGSGDSLVDHIRACAQCHSVLARYFSGPVVQYSDKVQIAKEVAEQWEL